MSAGLQPSSPATLPALAVAMEIIDAASTTSEVQHLRDQAEVVREFYKRQRARKKLYLAAEIKLRCERKLGLMLSESSARGRRLRDETLGTLRGSERSLPEGISKVQAFRWRRLATVPESEFVRWVAEQKAAEEELTQAALLRIADSYIHQQQHDLDLNDDGLDEDFEDDDAGQDEEEEDASGYIQRTVLLTTKAERDELHQRSKTLRQTFGTTDLKSTLLALVRFATSENEQ